MHRAHQWLLFLIPAVLSAGPPRFARLGFLEGGVRVQIHAYDDWRQGVRNVALVESSRIAGAGSSHLQLEFDEGSSLRLVGDAMAELSDYALLSTGQRITLISLDRGTAYLTGKPGENDSLSIAVPGAHVMLGRSSQVRFVVSDHSTEIAILEGTARFSTPTAEIELRHGQWVTLDPASHSRFKLLRDIPELETDKWTDLHTAELERAGHWIQTDDAGLVWKPKVSETWAPFQAGEWRWYDEVGYIWTPAETWGWRPYHYGRWLQHASLGWVWAPGSGKKFKPGEVYWMTSDSFTGWGPLAPGEEWAGAGHPLQYAALNTTLGRFTAGVREFGPAEDLTKPKDLIAATRFAVALPSPPIFPTHLESAREPLRSAGTRLISFAAGAINVPGASYTEHGTEHTAAAPAPKPPVAMPLRPSRPQAPPPPVVVEVVEPVEIYYPYPVYTGFVIVNPPVKKKDPKDKSKPNPHDGP